MIINTKSKDSNSISSRPQENMWKVTGKAPDLSTSWPNTQFSRKNVNSSSKHTKYAGNLQKIAILSRQHKVLDSLERKKEKLTAKIEGINPIDAQKSVRSKHAETPVKSTQKRTLVKELFPPPNVPEAAEYGIPMSIYNPDRVLEIRDLPNSEWFALKVHDLANTQAEANNRLNVNETVSQHSPAQTEQETAKKSPIEALNRLLEDLKLFSDEESSPSFLKRLGTNVRSTNAPCLKSIPVGKPASTQAKPFLNPAQSRNKSPPLPRLDLQAQTQVDQFALNLARSPQLIRQFFALETSGLSSDEQTNIIHFGLKLESKILELMDQYNNFASELGIIELTQMK